MPAHRAGLPHPCSALPRALDLRMLTRLDHAAAQMDEAAVEEMISTHMTQKKKWVEEIIFPLS